jgi:hypothetical protein
VDQKRRDCKVSLVRNAVCEGKQIEPVNEMKVMRMVWIDGMNSPSPSTYILGAAPRDVWCMF